MGFEVTCISAKSLSSDIENLIWHYVCLNIMKNTKNEGIPMNDIIHTPIGIIHSPFTDPDDTPIQGVFADGAKGEVEVFPEYSAGLKDIDGFSHLILIYDFHQVESYSLILKPFMEDKDRGIFSIRHPKRPNSIGISIVRLDNVRRNILEIRDVDIIDGTPLLDIKPFIDRFDNRIDIKSGWVDNQNIDEINDKTPRALRDK